MATAVRVSLCRPDDRHWCVECCGHGTYSCIERGSDGKRGCPADYFGWHKPSVCSEANCIPKLWPDESFTPQAEQRVREIISLLPPGEFKMSKAFELYLRRTGQKVLAQIGA